MPHAIKEFPPFEYGGEATAKDSEFENSCEAFIESLEKDHEIVRSSDLYITMNKEFGVVCRVDFATPHDNEKSVNRIMVWRGNDGQIRNFVGLEIPSTPLK